MKIKVNNQKKVVSVSAQAFAKAEPEDMELIQKYKAIGYEVEIVEAKRPKVSKITDADIRAALKDDKDALNTYLDLKKQSYFKGLKYFKSLNK